MQVGLKTIFPYWVLSYPPALTEECSVLLSFYLFVYFVPVSEDNS